MLASHRVRLSRWSAGLAVTVLVAASCSSALFAGTSPSTSPTASSGTTQSPYSTSTALAPATPTDSPLETAAPSDSPTAAPTPLPATPSPTATPRPTPKPTARPTATYPPADWQVAGWVASGPTSPVAIGGTESYEIQALPPLAVCSISVRYPSGASQPGLGSHTFTKQGETWTWHWTIPATAGTGSATLYNTCTYAGITKGPGDGVKFTITS